MEWFPNKLVQIIINHYLDFKTMEWFTNKMVRTIINHKVMKWPLKVVLFITDNNLVPIVIIVME
jgi:hypothetical protein